MRIAALVPMRHHSQRVPGKNYRPFVDRPLFHHIIATLLACPSVAEVAIDTDSPEIMDQCRSAFPGVRLLPRPAHLRADTTPMNDVLLNSTAQIEAEFYLQTHSTNPLLKIETIERAIAELREAVPAHDSLFGVTRLQTRLWDGLARPLNHNPNILLRTQDLPPVFEENSCLYLFRRETLVARHNRIGDRPILFEIDRLEAQDIDEEADFVLAEMLYRRRQAAP